MTKIIHGNKNSQVAEKNYPVEPYFRRQLMNKCSDTLIEQAAELYADRRVEEAMRWIPVNEKLPHKGQQVYVIGYREAELYTAAKKPSVGLVNWNTEKSSPCSDTCFYSFGYTNITHWMPIPELPKPTQP